MAEKKIDARKSSVIIQYNNQDATNTISKYLEAFQYTDNANSEPDSFTLSLNNRNGIWINDYMPVDGDYIKASIKVENWNKQGDNRTLSCGKFELDSFNPSGPPEVATLSGITVPINTDFNVTEKNKTWKNTTVKAILSDIASNAKVKLHYEAEDYSIEAIEQSGQTDMRFAYSLCEEYNLSMKIYDSKLVIYDQTVYESKKAAYKIDRVSMETWKLSKQITKLYDGVKIEYTNPDSDKKLTYSYNIKGNAKRILRINTQADSYQEAEIKAKSMLLANNRKAQELTIKVKGDPKYISAQNVNITGLGKLDGKYFIDKVTHSKNAKSGYYCTLKMHLCITNIDVAKTKSMAIETADTYTIVKGDNLWNIAKKYLGSGTRYMEIYNLNKSILKSPSLIYPGQVIKLPKK